MTIATATNWSTVAITAAVALAAAGFGAWFGAYVGGRVNRSLDQRKWLREQRAYIYRGALKNLHNPVNDIAETEARTGEPVAPPGELGVLFSDLYREAVVAGPIDAQMVRKFQTCWDTITSTYADFVAERGSTTNQQAVPIFERYHDLMLSAWQNANRVLREYNDFLERELLAEET
jgi:hypothetical protein